jgi:tRNA (guanine-N7-)-methyltransferase
MLLQSEYDYVVRAQDYIAYPLDWNEIFGNSNPLTVEVGFGNGEYTLEMARRHQDRNFIGFETSLTSVAKTIRRMWKDNVENVRILMVDGRFGLRNLFGDESVACIILNFPTPWSKNKHFKRRVAVPDFFRTLNMILSKDGRMELATDVVNYAVDTRNMALEHGFNCTPIVINGEREVITRFERKWIGYERNIHTMTLYKGQSDSVKRLLSEEKEMPHARVNVKGSNVDNIMKNLNKKWTNEDGTQICVFKKVYTGKDENSLLVKTIAVDMPLGYKEGEVDTEGDFRQHFFINLFKRGEQWLLNLEGTANPFRTPSVKYAVRKLADVMVSEGE